MKIRTGIILLLIAFSIQGKAQLFTEDFGTAFGNISTVKWPTACRGGSASSFNTSVGGCAGAGDYEYSLSGLGSYVTTQAITIPAAGYQLTFSYAFNLTFSFPAVEIRTGATCGTTLQQTVTLTNTSGACTPQSVSLSAYAGQTIYLRFRSNTSSATFYFDDVVVDVGGGGGPTCLLDENFGTAFTSIDATNWPSACRINSPSSFNTSTGPCSGASDYAYAMSGFVSVTTLALAIPSTGFTLDLNYSFNQTFSLPTIQVRTGASCGTSLVQTLTLPNTGGVCSPYSANLDAYAGQTIYLRFTSNSSSQTFYLDDIKVCGNSSASFKVKWADNFNDNDLLLDFLGNDGDENCPTCGPWVLGGGATLNLVPAGGWNGNTNKTEAFPANQANVYYVRLDRNEWIESPVIDMTNAENLKISFYAKSSSPGTGGGDTWSFSDRLRLQIWDGSAWQTVQSLRDDLGSVWSGPDDYISSALPFNYYCFTAYKSTSSPGNYYYTSAPNVNSAWFHSGFKFRVLFEGGVSGVPFAWVDDFTFRADNDGYSTMVPCGISFWNQPLSSGYGQDAGTTGNHNAEKGVELELDNSINIPPTWTSEADDGDAVTQTFGPGESERVVFAVVSEQEINFAFPKVHFFAPSMGWQSAVMSKDNSYSGPGWLYYSVQYISCDLAGGSIAEPTNDYRYYFSFEYGIEFMPVFYELNTSGIEYGGGVTSTSEVFNAPDVVSTDNCGLLPLAEIGLQGDWKADGVELKWNAITDQTAEMTWLERSADGILFDQIFQTSLEEKSYTWLDAEVNQMSPDQWFYRAAFLDQNGDQVYSDLVQIFRDGRGHSEEIFLYPNPSAGTSFLNFEMEAEGEVSLTLLNALGQEVWKKLERKISGPAKMEISPNGLERGIYWLILQKEGRKFMLSWSLN
ncbi:MAG: T9SS type A sorting domain-containing protein [Bacteroidia bacterium]|nr:T9SS type A sorting domain-containing protein [Bacteroidia bacterium]